MKIGVLTYWNSSDNYGQILQCYALQHFLKECGHDAILIKYSPRIQPVNPLFSVARKIVLSLSFRGLCYHFSKQRKIDKQKQIVEQNLIEENNKKNKKRQFPEFRDQYIDSYSVEYTSITELQNNPPKVDALICGSDQVWHNSYFDPNTAGWFLHFGSIKTLRIAYAASIGHKLTKKDLKKFKKLLEPFDAISVREQSVKEYAANVGYGNISITLDPTLLIDSSAYAFNKSNDSCNLHNNKDESYVFMYMINVKSTEDIPYNEIQSYTCNRKLDIKIVASSGYCPAHDIIPNKKNILATIPEWISLLKSADCVITTSFHGVVFSIIMRKRFLVIPLRGQYSASNERIENLLNRLSLNNRIYQEGQSLEDQIEKSIDWEDVYSRLNILKGESISFLSFSLNIQK